MSDAFTPYSGPVEAEVIPAEVTTDRSGLVIAEKPKPKILSPAEIRRLGAMQTEVIHDETMDQFLDSQRAIYEKHSHAALVETLLDRDRLLASEGRRLSNGQMQSQLLREFARIMVSGLRSGEVETIEALVRAMGGSPADLRQLKLHGHTLGTDPGERTAHFDELGQQAENFAKRKPEGDAS
jgi:hypothetical protein